MMTVCLSGLAMKVNFVDTTYPTEKRDLAKRVRVSPTNMRGVLQNAQRTCRLLRHCQFTTFTALRAVQPCLSEETGKPEGSTTNFFVKLFPWAVGLSAAAAWNECQCEASSEQGILTDVRLKVMRAWDEISQEMDRLEASLPFQIPLPRSRSPDIRLKGDKVSVQFKVIEGANFNDLLVDLVLQLGKQDRGKAVQDGQVQVEVTECHAAQVVQIHRSSALSAQVYIPRQGSREPEIEFLCDVKAGLSSEHLSIISSALRAANGITWHETGSSRSFSRSLSSRTNPTDLFAQSLGHIFREEFEGLRGQFGSLFDGFEQLGFPQQEGETAMFPGEQHQHSLGNEALEQSSSSRPAGAYGSPKADAAVRQLEKLGALVYPAGSKDAVDWGVLAGYEEQKEQIAETLLLALLHPEVYDEVCSKTRKQKASNRPRAVLFEGPPGCGKTTSARVLATQASAPLIYVPIEAIASKWYGESERKLGDIFKAAESLDCCLIFLDEIDSLATHRNSEMHEATRRILGVLLRQLDGFEGRNAIVIGATNRKADLDPALLSRFDASIYFQLPNLSCREQILKQYAQQLNDADIHELAEGCQGMSGRDIRDVCEHAERKTASKIIRGQTAKGSLPGREEYTEAVQSRQKSKELPSSARLAGLFPSKLM